MANVFNWMDSRHIDVVCKPYLSNQIIATYGKESRGKHYVLWSGGTDSTLLLYELLEAYGAENVVAISYKYPLVDTRKEK